jgi:presequence protease
LIANAFQCDTGSVVGSVRPFDAPKRVTVTGPLDAAGDVDAAAKVSVSFLLPEEKGGRSTDAFHVFACEILDTLLTDQPAGPLYQSLIESRLGTNYSPGTGFSDGTLRTYFSYGVQGVSSANLDRVEPTVISTLEKVAAEGFPMDRIEAILHLKELSLKRGSTNMGLAMISSFVHPWLHGGRLAEALNISDMIARFREELRKGPFLQNLVREMLATRHRLTLTMVPDKDYEAKAKAEEDRLVAKLGAALTEADLRRIDEEAAALADAQDAEQDPDCLPRIAVADIDRTHPVVHVDAGTTAAREPAIPIVGIVI